MFLVIYTLGQKVTELVNKEQPAGAYSYGFSAKALGLETGMYVARIMIGDKVIMRRLIETK